MPTKEKTYTFRAPEDLAPRAREAFRTWQELLAADDEASASAVHDAMSGFSLAVARRAKGFDQFENQSALIRATFELFVEATEKVAEDLKYAEAYEEWAQEDAEGPAVRRGAVAAAADRWRDE
jgi:hypothetical protein